MVNHIKRFSEVDHNATNKTPFIYSFQLQLLAKYLTLKLRLIQ